MDVLITQSNLIYATTLTVIFICTIYILLRRFSRDLSRGKNLRLPVCPPGWPIVGNAVVLFQHPGNSNADYYFSVCSRRYGDVYMLKLGPQMMYVLSNADDVRQVFTHSKVGGRLPAAAYELAFGPMTTSVVFASGPESRVMRRFLKDMFRDIGIGRDNYTDIVQTEIAQCVEKLGSLNDEPFWDLYELFVKSIGNMMCGVIFGTQFNYEDDELDTVIRFMKSFGKEMGPSAVVLLSKPLCKLPFGPGPRLMDCLAQFKAYLKGKIRETKSSLKSEDSPSCFVKAYLQEIEREGGGGYFNEANLIVYCLELFFAGTDTTANTLAWAILYLATHPDVQVKCQQEVDEFVAEYGVMPCSSDRSRLPFLQATTLETERSASVAPLGNAHLVEEDIQLLGYDFPKGTLVVANYESINMNPVKYPDPGQFRPERFIRDGRFENDSDIMPFSVGRRACMGEPLARMELFLFLVNLLRIFTFAVPEDTEMPDFRRAVYGGIRSPLPFAVAIKKRCASDP